MERERVAFNRRPSGPASGYRQLRLFLMFAGKALSTICMNYNSIPPLPRGPSIIFAPPQKIIATVVQSRAAPAPDLHFKLGECPLVNGCLVVSFNLDPLPSGVFICRPQIFERKKKTKNVICRKASLISALKRILLETATFI